MSTWNSGNARSNQTTRTSRLTEVRNPSPKSLQSQLRKTGFDFFEMEIK